MHESLNKPGLLEKDPEVEPLFNINVLFPEYIPIYYPTMSSMYSTKNLFLYKQPLY